MNWRPITRSEFDSIFEDALEELQPEQIEIYQRYKVEPALLECSRLPPGELDREKEYVFAAAKNKERFLVFDDVEGDFSIGGLDVNGILRIWGFFSSLGTALEGLAANEAFTPWEKT